MPLNFFPKITDEYILSQSALSYYFSSRHSEMNGLVYLDTKGYSGKGREKLSGGGEEEKGRWGKLRDMG